MRIALISICLILSKALLSQEISDIPDEIRKGADAVYLYDIGEFVITEDNRATYHEKTRIAILNPEGQRLAMEFVSYDKLTQVKLFEGEAFDQYGKSLKKLKKSEIVDQSAISGVSVYEDNRVMSADLRQIRYPYIVEFESIVEYKYVYYIPNWYFLPRNEVGVLHSRFRIESPLEYEPRYQVRNVEDLSTRKVEGNNVTIEFKYRNFKPSESEVYQPRDMEPMVLTSPSKFNFEDYRGDFSTWKSFGEWQNLLNKGLDDLPESTASEIRELVSGYSSDEEKIKAIYEYMQNNTRYVSIQLGIGGFQPFANSVVEETGYGDCKALSFYTQSLLKTAGIKSLYTIVYGGDNPPKVDRDFPNDRFNHIILCVPNKGDTLWLECTSQTNPFGYLGKFTGNRDVLLVTDEGGELARTPYYPASVNTQTTSAVIELDDELQSTAQMLIQYAGLQYENNDLNFIVNMGYDRQSKWVEGNFSVPGMEVEKFSMKNNKTPMPSIDFDMTFKSSKLVNTVGKRHFIQPNLFNKLTYVPVKNDNRRFDIEIDHGYTDVDSIVYHLPSTLRPEFMPEKIEVESEFGSYSVEVFFEQGKLTYVRKCLLNDGLFDKSKYEELRNFRKKIARSDKMKIALVSKT